MINQELINNYKGKTRTRIIEAIEISHSMLAENIYTCKYQTDLMLTLEDGNPKQFLPSNFVVKLPKYEENASLDITIAFAAVGFEHLKILEDILRTSNEKIKIKYRLYIEGSLNYPQTEAPFVFSIAGVEINNKNVTFNGSLLLSVQTNVPSVDYTVDNFRGLKYI